MIKQTPTQRSCGRIWFKLTCDSNGMHHHYFYVKGKQLFSHQTTRGVIHSFNGRISGKHSGSRRGSNFRKFRNCHAPLLPSTESCFSHQPTFLSICSSKFIEQTRISMPTVKNLFCVNFAKILHFYDCQARIHRRSAFYVFRQTVNTKKRALCDYQLYVCERKMKILSRGGKKKTRGQLLYFIPLFLWLADCSLLRWHEEEEK